MSKSTQTIKKTKNTVENSETNTPHAIFDAVGAELKTLENEVQAGSDIKITTGVIQKYSKMLSTFKLSDTNDDNGRRVSVSLEVGMDKIWKSMQATWKKSSIDIVIGMYILGAIQTKKEEMCSFKKEFTDWRKSLAQQFGIGPEALRQCRKVYRLGKTVLMFAHCGPKAVLEIYFHFSDVIKRSGSESDHSQLLAKLDKDMSIYRKHVGEMDVDGALTRTYYDTLLTIINFRKHGIFSGNLSFEVAEEEVPENAKIDWKDEKQYEYARMLALYTTRSVLKKDAVKIAKYLPTDNAEQVFEDYVLNRMCFADEEQVVKDGSKKVERYIKSLSVLLFKHDKPEISPKDVDGFSRLTRNIIDYLKPYALLDERGVA